MNSKRITILCTCALILIFAPRVWAKAEIFKKEVNLTGGYSDRDQWVGKKGMLLKNSVGFEYFKKFSDEYGDYMTADIQVRFSYDSLESSNDAWGIEIHNAWLDYKLGLGKNIRLGHFDPAFGLEPLLDTHGTLMQTLAIKNIGYKKDWGIGYRGLLGNYDVQAAAQLGSGMGIRSKDNNVLLSSRIGSSSRENFQYGASVLYGQVLESLQARTIPVAKLKSNNAKIKRRAGLDAQYTRGAYQWKNEFAVGTDDDDDVIGYWSELDYTLPSRQDLSFQIQGQYWINELGLNGSEDLTLGAGMSYALNSKVTLRVGYFHDIENFRQQEDRLALVQFYYFGN